MCEHCDVPPSQARTYGGEIPVNYVEYHDAAIVFSDAYPDCGQRAPAKRVLKMPPTKSDWWWANLDRVLLNP